MNTPQIPEVLEVDVTNTPLGQTTPADPAIIEAQLLARSASRAAAAAAAARRRRLHVRRRRLACPGRLTMN